MKIAFKALAASTFIALGVSAYAPVVNAQHFTRPNDTSSTRNECAVSGDYGGFTINEANNTVTGRFSISGDVNCAPAEVSIAVWMYNEGERLQDQEFFNGTTRSFGNRATQTNQAFATHDITTALPTSDDKCFLQIDLVRGGQRADPSHPFPNGPFYDGRRMNAIVIANPACQEVITETETVTVTETVEVPVDREVRVEVPVEVPVDREVRVEVERPVQTAKVLPNTGAGSLLAIPAATTIAAGATHYLRNRRKSIF